MAISIPDLGNFIAGLMAIITGKSKTYIIHREEYGDVTLEESENQIKVHGAELTYFFSENDFTRLVNYLNTCKENRKIIPRQHKHPQYNLYNRDSSDINWNSFLL